MFSILTIIGGAITAAPWIVSRKPNAQEIYARIAPFQGVLGAALLALGVFGLLRWLPILDASARGATLLGMIVANALVGLSMGLGLLSRLFARNEAAIRRSGELAARLNAVQVPLGLAAVGLGVASMVL